MQVFRRMISERSSGLNVNAKKELRRIQTDERTAIEWRKLAGEYLLSAAQVKSGESQSENSSKAESDP